MYRKSNESTAVQESRRINNGRKKILALDQKDNKDGISVA